MAYYPKFMNVRQLFIEYSIQAQSEGLFIFLTILQSQCKIAKLHTISIQQLHSLSAGIDRKSSNRKQTQKVSPRMKHTSYDQQLFVDFKPEYITLSSVSIFRNFILHEDPLNHDFSFIDGVDCMMNYHTIILYF